jgi:hypothetical protein
VGVYLAFRTGTPGLSFDKIHTPKIKVPISWERFLAAGHFVITLFSLLFFSAAP